MTIRESCGCGAETSASGNAIYELTVVREFRETHAKCRVEKTDDGLSDSNGCVPRQ